MERQIKGFEFEDKIIKENNYKKENNYTAKFDAYTNNNMGVQIKSVSSKGQLMMASPYNYMDIKENFELIVNNRKIIVDAKKLQKLFAEEHFVQRVNYVQDCLNKVTNNHSDDSKWKELFSKEKESRTGIIQIQGKRDHKNQKRVQWAIPNKFIDTFLNFIKV